MTITSDFLKEPTILSKGVYLQLVVNIKFLDDAIIRSNDPEEVLTFKYNPPLNNRFIIPWRKVKGKLRRLVLEKQRGLNIEPECYLKDALCMRCPTCFIFGGTGDTNDKGPYGKTGYNILARALGETFISKIEVGKKGVVTYTQNAVGEVDLMTGQALMSIVTVPKETEFIGVVTLKDPTAEMVSIIVDNLNRLTRLGARSVEWGRVKTEILGYNLSDRENLTAYDLVSKEKTEVQSGLTSIEKLNLPDVDTSYATLDISVKNLLKEHELIK
jgi:CRISPR type I-D-associated protein Csc2